MKKIFFTCIVFAFLVTGCRKGTGDPAPPPFSKGTPMPRGIPVGDAITKTIGASGGTIGTADSGIIVTVPPGAVPVNTEFSIQPITNTAPNGIGASFLLLPEGKHFNKPVSIQFKYTDDELDGTTADNLLVAYQDSAGIWNAAGGRQLDTINKTVTVLSEHFSRWSEFANTVLFVDRPSIDQNEVASLFVLDVIRKKDLGNKGLRTALSTFGDYVALNPSTATGFEVDWSYFKDGGLESIEGPYAKYRAPGFDPSPNPVTVSASLQNYLAPLTDGLHEQVLKRKIYVSSSYLELVLDGNTNIYPNATAQFKNGVLHIQAINQAGNGGLLNPTLSGAGSFAWGEDGGSKDIFIKVGGIPFGDSYNVCQPTSHTETTVGSINVTKWADKVGDFVEGNFSGQVVYNQADRSCTYVKKSIVGRFRAKRTI